MATTRKQPRSPFSPGRLRVETQQHRKSLNDVFAAQRLAAGQGRGSPACRYGLVRTRRGFVPLPQLPDRQTRIGEIETGERVPIKLATPRQSVIAA